MERTADRLGPSRINHHGFTVGVRSCAPWVFSNEPRLPGPFSVGWFSLSLVGSGCDATRDSGCALGEARRLVQLHSHDHARHRPPRLVSCAVLRR